MNPLLICQGLTKKYNTSYALDHLNLKINPGQIVGLLGPKAVERPH